MEAGTITRWLKSEGESVQKGEPLFEVDTDKVTQEVEADFAGVLLKIAVPEGEAPVGRTVAWIGEPGEEVQSEEPAAAKQEVSDPEVSDTVSAPPPALPADGDGRVKASPLARRIARERGIDLRSLTGTGPDGRIVAEDVERAQVAPAALAPA